MLKRSLRIPKELFVKASSQGKVYNSPHLRLVCAKLSDTSPSRYGVVVSKKVDNRAVRRNSLRRRLYELIRNNPEARPSGYYWIFSIKPGHKEYPREELQLEMTGLFRKALI